MKLSIIVPVYNGEKYLDRCLGSIASQTITGWELIIVNDGSVDDTGAIAEGFAREHPELTVRIIHQENHGLPQSRRIGVEAAEGEYVGFVDADDWIDADYFEGLLRDDIGADVIAGGFIEEREDGRKRAFPKGKDPGQGTVRQVSLREARQLLYSRQEVFQYVWNKIYRREILEGIDYPEENPIGEDFIIVNHALDRAKTILLTPERGYHYCIHGMNMSRQGFGQEKKQGYEEYGRLLADFDGTAEEREELNRYFMLEYMSTLLTMYRNKNLDPVIEGEILEFIRIHRGDYVRRTKDGAGAKAFALLINPLTSRIALRIWPKNRV